MLKISIFISILLTIIVIDYYKKKDTKKLLISLFLLFLIVSFVFFGLSLRAVLPLFLLYILSILLSVVALLYYIFKNRLLWWIFALPFGVELLFLILNFLIGSRYEV